MRIFWSPKICVMRGPSVTPQLITLCCKGGIMGASLRHCVAFKREKIMMHNLDSVFALKPLISLTCTRTKGRRKATSGGTVKKEPYLMGLSFCMRQTWEGQIGPIGPIGPLVPTPLYNFLVLDVQSAHVTKTVPRNRVGILLHPEILKIQWQFYTSFTFELLLLF
jgi:hypothetical protein